MHEVTRSRRSMRRRLVVALAALGVVLTASGFGAYALTRDEPTHFDSIGCFEKADLGANAAIVGVDGRSPTEICAEVWATGGFGPGRAVPALQACVLETGAVGVFPGSGAEVCNRLGIAALGPGYEAKAARFAALRDDIVAGLQRCVGEEGARAVVRGELNAHGFAGWRFELVAPFTAERPCAELGGLDVERKRVVVVPGERGGAPPGGRDA